MILFKLQVDSVVVPPDVDCFRLQAKRRGVQQALCLVFPYRMRVRYIPVWIMDRPYVIQLSNKLSWFSDACLQPLSDNQEGPKQYVNVKIPQELVEEIERLIKKKKLGYRSRAEFVIEACRERILRIREAP